MGANATNTNVNPETGTGDNQEQQPKSFYELFNDESYKSEYEKRLAQELASAKGKWESDHQQKLEEAKTEAEKLAKMNADQKAQYEQQKRLSELEAREKDITTRELKATAYETLAEKGLPKDLADILDYADAESCNKSIESVEKAFQLAVEKAVNEKLRGSSQPPKNGGNGSDATGFGFNFTGVRPRK